MDPFIDVKASYHYSDGPYYCCCCGAVMELKGFAIIYPYPIDGQGIIPFTTYYCETCYKAMIRVYHYQKVTCFA